MAANGKDKNLHEIMEEIKQTPKESLGPERKRLRRKTLIRELMNKLNTVESEEERMAIIHEYIIDAVGIKSDEE